MTFRDLSALTEEDEASIRAERLRALASEIQNHAAPAGALVETIDRDLSEAAKSIRFAAAALEARAHRGSHSGAKRGTDGEP